jgi:PPP family 3-phenylpropionic acid transporter
MNRGRLIYLLYYAGAACLIPFLTLHYESLGLSGPQIGTLAGLVPLITLVSAPLWGGLSDATGRHRLTLLGTIGGTWLAVLLMSQLVSFSGLLPAVALYAFFMAPIIPLIDNSVMEILGEKRNQYGRIRMWGAFGWGAAALVLGPLLGRAGLIWVFYGYLFFMALTLIVSFKLPVASAGRNGLSYRANLGHLLRNGPFVALLFVALTFGFTLSVTLNYLFLYMGRLGATTTMMSLTLTLATVAEVPIWFISDRLFNRVGRDRMILLALGFMAVRLFGYALMTAAWWALPLSLLHGPTFAVLWAAGVAEADAAAPRGLGATAQGLFSAALVGLGSALGAFLGGIGYDAIGPQRLFLLCGLLMVVTMAAYYGARRLMPARPAAARLPE